MLKRWKKFDETRSSAILKGLSDGAKTFNQLWNELERKGIIKSKTTLNQYLKHLVKEEIVHKIVAPMEGKRLAYEIVSKEHKALAREAVSREAGERESFRFTIPPEDPLDPQAIEVIRASFKPSPKPTPHDLLSEKVVRIKCVCLENLKSQLETWKTIKTSENESERLRCWIEDAFTGLFMRIRMDFNWIALLMNADFYTPQELMEAVDILHKEAIEELTHIPQRSFGVAE